MDKIKKDYYDLNYSENYLISDNQELNIDIELKNSDAGTSSIVGTVLDDKGLPVEEATIKLFDNAGKPYLHTVTNAKGEYSFNGLKSDSYSITCVKENIILTVPETIFLQGNEIKTFNFVVNAEASLDYCTIAGIVTQSDNDKVIEDAKIFLIDAITKETVATTTSANDGEYVFYDVKAGDYLLLATKNGYNSSGEISIKAIDKSIINLNIKLFVNPIENLGTISGIISHNGVIIANAFVELYKIENGKEVLVATTKTNASGLYMFGKVEKGEYKVKAKLIKD